MSSWDPTSLLFIHQLVMQSILGKIDLGRNSHFETQGASSNKSISMDHYVGWWCKAFYYAWTILGNTIISWRSILKELWKKDNSCRLPIGSFINHLKKIHSSFLLCLVVESSAKFNL
jgi:hypothetical protein